MSNHTFTTNIENAEFEISFDYQPEEAMVMYYPDGSGYPGCSAAIEGWSANWVMKDKGDLAEYPDVTDLLIELGFEDEIEEKCFENMASNAPD